MSVNNLCAVRSSSCRRLNSVERDSARINKGLSRNDTLVQNRSNITILSCSKVLLHLLLQNGLVFLNFIQTGLQIITFSGKSTESLSFKLGVSLHFGIFRLSEISWLKNISLKRRNLRLRLLLSKLSMSWYSQQ